MSARGSAGGTALAVVLILLLVAGISQAVKSGRIRSTEQAFTERQQLLDRREQALNERTNEQLRAFFMEHCQKSLLDRSNVNVQCDTQYLSGAK